ncbi:hypothetical protein TNCV_2471131 [Trichonephila clavipes]|nr:hypothetical protein TNCV_2471131 [Trichonephila clavipes]
MKKIHKVVQNDRRLKVSELADIEGISKSAVHRIVTENLDMRKLCIVNENYQRRVKREFIATFDQRNQAKMAAFG